MRQRKWHQRDWDSGQLDSLPGADRRGWLWNEACSYLLDRLGTLWQALLLRVIWTQYLRCRGANKAQLFFPFFDLSCRCLHHLLDLLSRGIRIEKQTNKKTLIFSMQIPKPKNILNDSSLFFLHHRLENLVKTVLYGGTVKIFNLFLQYFQPISMLGSNTAW